MTLTAKEQRLLNRALRRARIAPGLKPVELPPHLAALFEAQTSSPASSAATVPSLPAVATVPALDPSSPAAQFAALRDLQAAGMPPATLQQLASSYAAGGNNVAGFWDNVGDAIDVFGQAAGYAVPLLQQTGVISGPYGGGSAYPGMPSGGGLAGTFNQWLQPQQQQQGFLPFVDVVPDGVGQITEPFYTSPTGQQRAKAHIAVRSNGKVEWFIPAGKPLTWSKATVKKARRCCPSVRVSCGGRRRPR